MNKQHNPATVSSESSLTQWLTYLESIHPTAIDMGLTRVKNVAERLAITLSDTLVITVAGTNGKGTTCRLLEQALLAQGKTVAVYGSPHLVDYRERVRINGEWANASAFVAAFNDIEQARGEISLTYFEFGTLAAMQMMQQWQVDVAILEVGLGGRLDATNIIDPDLAIITTIDLDHQDWLGDTRDEIAREKAGIMRAQGKAVLGELDPPASLHEEVNRLNVDAVWATRDFFSAPYIDETTWNWHGKSRVLTQLPKPHIPLQNVCTALAALETLDLLPSEERVKHIIANTHLPGRQQQISEAPLVVVDVAHNPQATKAMRLWLEHYQASRIHAVVGMLKDKSVTETLAPLSPLNAQWYVADTHGPRGLGAQALADALTQNKVSASCIATFDSVASAYSQAREAYSPGDLVLVFGSFVTVAEVMSVHQSE
ncbi:bifunctional tetrahydrofolate synthase/dihydrofolate synthase [Alteromonas profundi]|uniref:bifunctional tetrahydrofolate synthase/dihydrofolate synthase n=1 Tax=Alteromonas profundi TaxID=2696062 RepID=UPI0031B5B136